MVMKEIPRDEAAEEKPLLTMASQVGAARGSEHTAPAGRAGMCTAVVWGSCLGSIAWG